MIQFQTRKYFYPDLVYVEKSIARQLFTVKLLSKLKNVPLRHIDNPDDLIGEKMVRKNTSLLLAKQNGPFLRYCPGTSKHICCMYHNLDVAAGCDLNCTYCILQGYLNTPCPTIYCNIDDMFRELDDKFSNLPNQFFRIGTGELSDSLTYDHITGLSVDLIRYFSDKRNAIIELKSKNVHIENLFGLRHNRRTVVSWSLNSANIQKSEESQAPSLDDRLKAASEIQNEGYWLGFHFDPMIYYEGWEDEYGDTVDKIFRFAKSDNIAWISLGALRYPPGLDEIIRKNHPQSGIVLGELVHGVDNKYRYFKPIRIQLFKNMYKWIRKYTKDVPVYLCMESDEVWRKSFGWSPGTNAKLKTILDDRVKI